MNATIIDFLNRVTDDLQLQLAFEEEKVLDENGDNVETRYKVVNRKLDGNPGKIFKLTINCYHTASRILVNGSRVDFFCIGLPLVKQQISQFCTDLTYLNQIFERTLLACNLNKHYQTQTTDKIEASMAERQTVEVVDNSEPSPGQSIFLCPSCEEIADQQTMCCETCDSWFHYNCVGITLNDVEKISSDVPYIYDNCTENLIYDSNQTLTENRNLPTSQDHGQGLSQLHNSYNQTDSLLCT